MFTNTTYAALSMLDGDQFAKKFGPSDWFLLTITGEDASNNPLGSVNFYLARNGSIVNTWQSVDLSSLSAAKTLEFNLTSSDTGLYGMNTPAYFAMDDLALSSTGELWNYTRGSSGSWMNGQNWSPATVPSGGTVMFAGTPAAPVTVTLDGSQSAGTLVFNVSGTNGYTLSQGTGGGALTLGTSAGGSIAVVSGTNRISTPIVLAGSLAVNTSNGGSLDLSGSVSQAAGVSAALSLSGSGMLILSGTGSYSGGTTITNGSLCVTNSNALPEGTNLTIGAGGVLIFDPSAVGGTWSYTAGTSGSWMNGNNWSPATIPTGGRATVTFPGTPSPPVTVTLDGNQSAGALVFDDSGSNGYTLSRGTGGGALTLGTSAGASITVVSGSNAISAPIVLAGSLAVGMSSGGSLDLSGSVSQVAGVSAALSLSGDGQLILSGTDSYTGGTTVNDGTLYVTNSSALPDGTNLTIGPGGAFIFDPAATAAQSLAVSPAATAAVPEPGMLGLLAAGGVCLVAARFLRRRRNLECGDLSPLFLTSEASLAFTVVSSVVGKKQKAATTMRAWCPRRTPK